MVCVLSKLLVLEFLGLDIFRIWRFIIYIKLIKWGWGKGVIVFSVLFEFFGEVIVFIKYIVFVILLK